MIILAFFYPIQDYSDSLMNYAYILIGMPILVLNLWAWDAPHIIEAILGLKPDEDIH